MGEKLNLYQKIQAVANDIKGIEKDMSVGTGGNSSYRAVSDKNVILKVKAAEQKHGVISIPIKQELIKSETLESKPDQYGKVKVTYVDIIKMTVKVIDIDNSTESIEIESFGRGVDSSDKGFGKAATYARKYALLNLYKIATGVDPDQEESKPIEKAATEDIIKLKVENYLLCNDDYREKTFAHFNCAELSEFTNVQIKTIYSNLAKKGLL